MPSPSPVSSRTRRPKPALTKDQLHAAIRAAAAKLGRPPSHLEFIAQSGITLHKMLKLYPTWNQAVLGAGLRPWTKNAPVADAPLLEDWGLVARRIKKAPTQAHYERNGRFSRGVFKRFCLWSKMPERFRQFARGREEWNDVLELFPTQPLPASNGRRGLRNCPPGRPVSSDRVGYGEPIGFRSLVHEPTDESGVIFVFGMLAEELDYRIECIRARFPDCLAKRRVRSGRWEDVLIEFEFESKNFKQHGHPPAGCDLIVCWRHNWPECPVEVLELRTRCAKSR